MLLFLSTSLLFIGLARADVCTPNGGVYTITNKVNAGTMPQDCTIIRGSVAVLCESALTAPGGGLNHLTFLHAVVAIEGFLRIEGCSGLPNLNDLSSLKTILGSVDYGLQILNNDLLPDVKGLENLETITEGGVNIFFNDNLCYLDLMDWARLIPADAIPASVTVKYFQKPARCLITECSADCDCGHCGGPGSCSASCPAAPKGWIAAAVLGGLLGLALVILLVVLCVRGWCEFEGKITRRPMKKRKLLPDTNIDIGSGAGADIWVNQRADVATAPVFPVTNLPPLRENPQPLYDQASAAVVPVAPAPQVLDAMDEGDEGEGAAAQSGEDAFCVCGKPAEFDCSRCTKQSYCSNECQRGDWKAHRVVCKRLVEEARLAAAGKVVAPVAPVDKCELCDKPAQFECSRCGGPGYCSAICQRAHWKTHAAECRKARGARRADAGAPTAASDAAQTAVDGEPAKPANNEYFDAGATARAADEDTAVVQAALTAVPQQPGTEDYLSVEGRESDL